MEQYDEKLTEKCGITSVCEFPSILSKVVKNNNDAESVPHFLFIRFSLLYFGVTKTIIIILII